MSRNRLDRVLAFAAAIEVGTGLVLQIVPAIVITLLLGGESSAVGTQIGRCFGIALIALGVSCWPRASGPEIRRPALHAMLVYNALIALYLAYLGALEHTSGLLLWPGVALHAVMALMLVRVERQS